MREGYAATLVMARFLIAPWLTKWAGCEASPALFARADQRWDSFSRGWARVSRCLNSAAELLTIEEALGRD